MMLTSDVCRPFRSTCTTPAASKPLSARVLAARSRFKPANLAVVNLTEPKPSIPASRHRTRPTANAFPGNRAATSIHGHGMGPLRKRRALTVCRCRSTEVGTRSVAAISDNRKISPDNLSPHLHELDYTIRLYHKTGTLFHG